MGEAKRRGTLKERRKLAIANMQPVKTQQVITRRVGGMGTGRQGRGSFLLAAAMVAASEMNQIRSVNA